MQGKSKSILLIEDDADLREIVSGILRSEGYFVHQAQNGEEGIQLLQGLPSHLTPGCILLDWMMPKMGGHDFLEALSKMPEIDLSKLKVIISTASNAKTILSKPNSLAVETLRKPMDLDHLLRSIHSHCS